MRMSALTVAVLMPMAICTSLACRSSETAYGHGKADVEITTEGQEQLLRRQGADGRQSDEFRKLAATVYVLTVDEWHRLDLQPRLELIYDTLRRGDQARSRAAMEDMLGRIARYRRGEGRTPITIPMMLRVHRILVERDGSVASIEFNPKDRNRAVLGL